MIKYLPVISKEWIKDKLRSPLVLIVSVVLGLFVGTYFPEFSKNYGHLGDTFVSLLTMCVIPILITALISSIKTFIVHNIYLSVSRVLGLFLGMIVLIGVVGCVVTSVGQPGARLDASSPVLKSISVKAAIVDREFEDDIEPTLEKGLLERFLTEALPRNVVFSISNDKILQILIFCFVFGVALAHISKKPRKFTILLLEGIRDTFERIFTAITLGLPIAVFFIMARDVAHLGTATLIAMVGFVATTYAAMFVLFVINSVILYLRTGKRLLRTLNILKEPLFIAVAAGTSVAAIPAAVKSMEKGFKYDKDTLNIFVPLGIVIGQYGTLIYFTCGALFVAQFYNAELGPIEYGAVILTAIIATNASVGARGALKLPLLAIVLLPLELPLGALLTLFMAVDSFIVFGTSFTTVHTNCAIVALILPRKRIKMHR